MTFLRATSITTHNSLKEKQWHSRIISIITAIYRRYRNGFQWFQCYLDRCWVALFYCALPSGLQPHDFDLSDLTTQYDIGESKMTFSGKTLEDNNKE